MKKLIVSIMCFIFLLAGCVSQDSPVNSTQESTQTNLTQPQERLDIITSFYPLYEIVHQIGGDRVNVRNLVPAGVEPHDFEPSTQDLISLHKADLVIYNGSGFEPWTEKIIPELQKNNVQVLNQSELVIPHLLISDKSTAEEEHNEEHESEEHEDEDEEHKTSHREDDLHEESHEHSSGLTDPHFWLDPNLYLEQIQGISRQMIELDPANQSYYEENTQRYLTEIKTLDQQFSEGLEKCNNRTIITSHAAFAYLAKRYNLEMVPITGMNPEGEPSPKALSEHVKLIKSKSITAVFTETLINPKIAEVLAQETGAKVFVLNPLEGLTPRELSERKNYTSIMRENLENLRKGLQCE